MKKITHSEPFTSKEDIKAIKKQIHSGMHATGKKTEEFEEKISELIGVKYGKATTSGTTALHLALLSLNIGKDDEVIMPSYACQSVMNAVNYTGAKPILADIDIENNGYNLSDRAIKPLITKKTKAIIVPHLFGFPVDINKIRKVSKKIPLIEDCAHCLGGKYKSKMLGSFGDLSIFSFYATKVISTGHGGMVLTNSKKIKEELDDLTKYDKRDKYKIAYNYGLSDINSALGLSQLKKLKFFTKRRKEILERYNKEFNKFSKPLFPEGSSPFRYIIQLKNKKERDEVKKKLNKKNIMADKPIFKPLHQYLNLNSKDFKNTEKAYDNTLSIPLYPALTNKEVEYIMKNLIECLKD